MKRDLSIIGRTFNQLTVLRVAGMIRRSAAFLCRCTCGNKKVVTGSNLKFGSVKSCGCRKIEHARKMGSDMRQHGMSRTRTYSTWRAMLSRCQRKNNAEYARYGGRGIRVCKRWLSFKNFLADMGERPDGKSLDRFPDRNGDYKPSNCRWATPKQQSRNQDCCKQMEWQGQTLPLVELCEKLGINYHTASSRFKKGFPLHEVISSKRFNAWHRTCKCDRLLTFRGQTKRVVDWAKAIGIKKVTLYARLNKGWSIERALTTPVRGKA